VAVSMIKALSTWHGLSLSPAEVAELACYIEIEKMGMPVGKQDQYAASFGGLNCIVFTKAGVTVEPLRLPGTTLETLQRRLMLFFLGGTRKSSSILKYQKRATEKADERTIYTLHAMKELGLAIKDALEQGDLKAFGELLDLSWQNKRTLAPISPTPSLMIVIQRRRRLVRKGASSPAPGVEASSCSTAGRSIKMP